jgi:(p)ppGpp synthase/HD superfamily hydrolase
MPRFVLLKGICRLLFMDSTDTAKEICSSLLGALKFAAQKHSRQRRKDLEATPYINHPITVAEILSRIGGISDLPTLQAAILHDTIEDTDTSARELEHTFGQEVCFFVQELTDDKRLPITIQYTLPGNSPSEPPSQAEAIRVTGSRYC